MNKMTNNPKVHYPKLFALCKKLGIDDEQRRAIIYNYTNEKKTSLKELNEREVLVLISGLQQNDYVKTKGGTEDTMRKKIIHQARLMGYETPAGKADMERIHNWVTKYGYLHKPLNDYNSKELPILVTQFETYYHQFLNRI